VTAARFLGVLASLLLAVAIGTASAQSPCAPLFDWRGFYPPEVLDRVAQRSAPGMRDNFDEVLLPRLTDRERSVLRDARLDLSQREYKDHPLNFYAARGGLVVLPLSSVRLVSDLSLALAWLNRHGLPRSACSTIRDAGLSRAHAGRRAGAAAQRAGRPQDADSDPAIDSLYQKIVAASWSS